MFRLQLTPRHGGDDRPEYNDSLANERTFLAWIRTALALVAAGLAAARFLPQSSGPWAQLLGGALVMLGMGIAWGSIGRWARNEEAMAADEPLAASAMPRNTALGVMFVAAVAALLPLFGAVR